MKAKLPLTPIQEANQLLQELNPYPSLGFNNMAKITAKLFCKKMIEQKKRIKHWKQVLQLLSK